MVCLTTPPPPPPKKKKTKQKKKKKTTKKKTTKKKKKKKKPTTTNKKKKKNTKKKKNKNRRQISSEIWHRKAPSWLYNNSYIIICAVSGQNFRTAAAMLWLNNMRSTSWYISEICTQHCQNFNCSSASCGGHITIAK